ncbi:MAG: dihydroneopterin aldolase [Cryomorphaceae bacterium]|nr:dihydroneopterin aldolase [Cryomorphaceae bacterium]
MKQQIKVKNIRIYAFHGCLEEEAKIGSNYRCDLTVFADLTHSAQTDELSDTIDYVSLTAIVKEEMQIRAKLLETVAKRIADRVLKLHDRVSRCRISVSKISPPIEADVEEVAVVWEEKR